MGRIKEAIIILIISLVTAIVYHQIRFPNFPFIKEQNNVDEKKLEDINSLDLKIYYIDFKTLKKWLKKYDDLVLIDARFKEDYEKGHINRAINLPEPEFDKYFPEIQDILYSSERIVVYCVDIYCDMSEKVAKRLLINLNKPIFVYKEGYEGWKKRVNS